MIYFMLFIPGDTVYTNKWLHYALNEMADVLLSSDGRSVSLQSSAPLEEPALE